MNLALPPSFISKSNPSCFLLILFLTTSCKTSEEINQNGSTVPAQEPAMKTSAKVPAKNYSLHIPIEQVGVTQSVEDQVPDDASNNQKLQYQ